MDEVYTQTLIDMSMALAELAVKAQRPLSARRFAQ